VSSLKVVKKQQVVSLYHIRRRLCPQAEINIEIMIQQAVARRSGRVAARNRTNFIPAAAVPPAPQVVAPIQVAAPMQLDVPALVPAPVAPPEVPQAAQPMEINDIPNQVVAPTVTLTQVQLDNLVTNAVETAVGLMRAGDGQGSGTRRRRRSEDGEEGTPAAQRGEDILMAPSIVSQEYKPPGQGETEPPGFRESKLHDKAVVAYLRAMGDSSNWDEAKADSKPEYCMDWLDAKIDYAKIANIDACQLVRNHLSRSSQQWLKNLLGTRSWSHWSTNDYANFRVEFRKRFAMQASVPRTPPGRCGTLRQLQRWTPWRWRPQGPL